MHDEALIKKRRLLSIKSQVQELRTQRANEYKLPDKWKCDTIIMKVEKRLEDSSSSFKKSCLENPFVRRNFTQQLNNMEIAQRHQKNAELFILQKKQKQYDRLCDILKEMEDKTKGDERMNRRLVYLKHQTVEMKDKCFEEGEYTHTLNHMIGRYHSSLLHKHQPMENRIREYKYLVGKKQRYEYEKNLYKISVTESVSKHKRDLDTQASEYAKLRANQIEIAMAVHTLKEQSEKLKAFENEDLDELNHKRESKSKTEKEKELKHQVEMKEKMIELLQKVNSSIIKDIVYERRDKCLIPDFEVNTYDVSHECNLGEFLSEDEVREREVAELINKNRAPVDTSDDSHSPSAVKEYVVREYIIMAKETLDQYEQKRVLLRSLKEKLAILTETHKAKRNAMSKHVAMKIMEKSGKNTDLDTVKSDEYGSEPNTDAASDYVLFIPDINTECERILLSGKRECEESKMKLIKAKELVTAACGLISRVCQEIRVTNKEGKLATIDVIESNVSRYMSLCGLKFEKLMRNNKLIKAQFERLVEINNHKGENKIDLFNMQKEISIYGFSRININIGGEEDSEDGAGSDN